MSTRERRKTWVIRGTYINLGDYEQDAKRILPLAIHSYYSAGAADEITLRENEQAYRRVQLRPRILRDVSRIKFDTKWLGNPVSMPIGIAPTAMQCMAHPDGELATVRGKYLGWNYEKRHSHDFWQVLTKRNHCSFFVSLYGDTFTVIANQFGRICYFHRCGYFCLNISGSQIRCLHDLEHYIDNFHGGHCN